MINTIIAEVSQKISLYTVLFACIQYISKYIPAVKTALKMFVRFAGTRKISPALLQGIYAVYLLSKKLEQDYSYRTGYAKKAGNQSFKDSYL